MIEILTILSENMENKYKTKRIIDGKPRWVIVNDNGNIINRNPINEELKGLKKEIRTPRDTRKGKTYNSYTNEYLLNYLTQFYDKYGRTPTETDFRNNREYPNPNTYKRRFGGWQKALKLVWLDVDSMIKKGIIETSYQKARFAEMIVRDTLINNQ